MKYSVFPAEDYNTESKIGGSVQDYNLLIDTYPQAFFNGSYSPNLMLNMFWFIRKTSMLVLVDRNERSPLSTLDSGINTFVINECRSHVIEINNRMLSSLSEEDEDEFYVECYNQTDDVNVDSLISPIKAPEIQHSEIPTFQNSKPTRLRNPSDITDDPKALKAGSNYNSYTPNTASNSSMSGSTKFITRSKLNPKSQVYKANSSKPSNQFGSENSNKFINPGKPKYNPNSGLATINSERFPNARPTSEQALFHNREQFSSHQIGFL